MESKQRNGRKWTPPRQNGRSDNAAKHLTDGFGIGPNAAFPPGARQRTPLVPPPAEEGKPTRAAIVLAVEELREDHPRIDVGGLYLQFRCRGGRWSLVTREDVRAALADIECAARREFRSPEVSEAPKRAAVRTPQGYWEQFQQAVADLHDGGTDPETIVRTLTGSGWRRVHRDDVTAALRRLRTANTPWHFRPGRPLPAPRPAPPGLCPSCDFPVTDLGLCRCS
jgi:hypothetical protein